MNVSISYYIITSDSVIEGEYYEVGKGSYNVLSCNSEDDEGIKNLYKKFISDKSINQELEIRKKLADKTYHFVRIHGNGGRCRAEYSEKDLQDAQMWADSMLEKYNNFQIVEYDAFFGDSSGGLDFTNGKLYHGEEIEEEVLEEIEETYFFEPKILRKGEFEIYYNNKDIQISKIEKIKNQYERKAIEELGEKYFLKDTDFEVDVLGHIDKLRLYNKNLKSIPEIIGKLPELKYLDLDNNQINQIENIDNLIKLENLRLNKNYVKEIKGLNNLIQIKELNLQNNQIEKLKGLGTLKNLADLKLENNPLFLEDIHFLLGYNKKDIQKYCRNANREEQINAKIKRVKKKEKRRNIIEILFDLSDLIYLSKKFDNALRVIWYFHDSYYRYGKKTELSNLGFQYLENTFFELIDWARKYSNLDAFEEDREKPIRIEMDTEELKRTKCPLLMIAQQTSDDIYIRALTLLEIKEASNWLIEQLKSGKITEDIIVALGRFGVKEAVKPLLNYLSDGHFQIVVLTALGRIGSVEAVKPILKLIEDFVKGKMEDEHYYIITSIQALGEIGFDDAVKPLVKLFNKYNSGYNEELYVQGAVIKALKKIRSKEAIQFLEKLPINKILEQTKDIMFFIQELKDKSCQNNRIAAAGALGNIGNIRAIIPLIQTLKEEDPQLRRATIEALGKIGDTMVIFPLTIALNDESSIIRETTVKALEKLGWKPINNQQKAYYLLGKKAWKELESLKDLAIEPFILGLKDLETQKNAIEALERLNDRRAVEPLIQLLKEKELNYPIEILSALGSLRDGRIVEPIISFLSKNSKVQWNIIDALGFCKMIRTIEAVDPFIKMLNSENKFIKATAIHTLQLIYESNEKFLKELLKKILDTLILELESGDIHVRISAAEALGTIKDKRGVEPLIKSLNTEHIILRGTIISSLGERGDKRAIKPLQEALEKETYHGDLIIKILKKLQKNSK